MNSHIIDDIAYEEKPRRTKGEKRVLRIGINPRVRLDSRTPFLRRS